MSSWLCWRLIALNRDSPDLDWSWLSFNMYFYGWVIVVAVTDTAQVRGTMTLIWVSIATGAAYFACSGGYGYEATWFLAPVFVVPAFTIRSLRPMVLQSPSDE
ncbi:MAG: hypothetical protein H6737_25465 [Alphaproteobacteria bacterium]|nr:hypothetical protein [Alphaproteobacteria bacterium]